MRRKEVEFKQVIDKSSTAAEEIVEAVHDVDKRIKEESVVVGKTVTQIDDKILALDAFFHDQVVQIKSSYNAIETIIAYNYDTQAQIDCGL
jgi:hypothetical protein